MSDVFAAVPDAAIAATDRCGRCDTELAPSLLACPSCAALVHGEALKHLAADAEAAERSGDNARALARWREALELLPSSSTQYDAIVQRTQSLAGDAEAAARKAAEDRVRSRYGKHGPVIGAIAVFLFKFKTLLIVLLTKGKFILLGLTKLKTLASMAVFLGFRASYQGWPLALGVVLSIYIHEMGHVIALHRHGIKASAPMFIPGVGAFILARERIHGVWAEADVGLAGPVYGLGAAMLALVAFLLTKSPLWASIAGFGALINLFNLMPVWQLDGAHAFRAMSRNHRLVAVFALAAALAITRMGLLWLPLLGAVWAVFRTPPQRADARAVGYYSVLVASLSAIAMFGTIAR